MIMIKAARTFLFCCCGLIIGWHPNNNNNYCLGFSYSKLQQQRQQQQDLKRTTRFVLGSTSLVAAATTATARVGPRISIDEDYPGAKRIYSNPDIFVIENFLAPSHCDDMIARAQEKKLERSPVAYAGWTEDFKDLVELAAKGPVAWSALFWAWWQLKDSSDATQVDLVIHSLQNYAVILVLAVSAIAAFTFARAEGLKGMRTSTSTTLDDLRDRSSGSAQFVKKAARLFGGGGGGAAAAGSGGSGEGSLRREAALFEAPTVIRYEPDQVLAPHYDANRSAETEDANRGGQTLATLIVYLNDVKRGGLTRFGKLPSLSDSGEEDGDETKLTVRPKRGDALLFFPADAMGRFDEATEHEGCSAVDEKWIARIWRHKSRVPPPFGLSESSLSSI